MATDKSAGHVDLGDGPPLLAVVLSRGALATGQARAATIAERCGADLVLKRPKLETLFEQYDLLYVVNKEREELVSRSGIHLFVHAAMLRSKLQAGREHPFLRACWPAQRQEPPRVIVDATLGLCTDALHLAGATGAQVLGLETSPVLFSLAEEGVKRLRADRYPAVAKAARLVEPLLVDHHVWLSARAAASVDVLFVDPMFENPPRGDKKLELFRCLANARPVAAATMDLMRLVARRHVVYKLRAGWRTEPAGLAWHRRECGARTDLLVHDVQAR